MNTQTITRFVLPIVAVIAIGSLAWQQGRLARAHLELERLQSENASLPALREAVAESRHLEIDQAELARLREGQASLQRELDRARALAARTLRAEAVATTARAELEQHTREHPVGESGIAGPMAEMMHGVLEERSRRQLARMREHLHLTPFQAEAIGQILDRRARGMAEAMKGVYSGRMDSEKIAAFREGNGDPESQILALLSPDQQAAYAQMRDEERVNTALTSANSEFLQMRHTLDLRDDQEDQVFDILHAEALRVQFPLESDDPQPARPDEVMQLVMERKLESLAEVLTPEQLASYRQQQELQLGFLKGMMNRIQDASAQP